MAWAFLSLPKTPVRTGAASAQLLVLEGVACSGYPFSQPLVGVLYRCCKSAFFSSCVIFFAFFFFFYAFAAELVSLLCVQAGVHIVVFVKRNAAVSTSLFTHGLGCLRLESRVRLRKINSFSSFIPFVSSSVD